MADVKVIMEKLEKGVQDMVSSGKFENWLRFLGTFHNYSFNNTVLIYLQNPDATLVAGYKAWQDKHRQVKKGEKGIKILAPIPHKYVQKVKNADGEEEEKTIQYTSFHTVSVFDVSQTEGEDLPEVAKTLTGSVENFAELFSKLTAASPVTIEIKDLEHNPANGFYSHETNSIVVKAGLSEQQTIKTTIHEIAHAMLHSSEGTEKDADKNTREVQAESVAYAVCNALGLDTSDYSFGYIAGWSKGKDLKELQESLDVIRNTTDELIKKLA